MKKFLFTLLLSLIPGILHANVCAKHFVMPAIKIDASPGNIIYDHNKDKLFLKNKSKSQIHVPSDRHMNGLTEANLKLDVRVNFVSQMVRGGTQCIMPKDVDFFVGYDDVIIYIAKHIKKGTCRYKVTKNHELQHYEFNKQMLKKYIFKFQDALVNAIKAIGSMEAYGEETASLMLAEYTRAVKEIEKQMVRDMQKLHGQIDSVENYKKEDRMCKF